jgi:hypothetical protein
MRELTRNHPQGRLRMRRRRTRIGRFPSDNRGQIRGRGFPNASHMLRLNASERLAIQLFGRANHEKNTRQHRDRCTDGKDNKQLLCGEPIRSTARLSHLSLLWSRQAEVTRACIRQWRAQVNLLISQESAGQCAFHADRAAVRAVGPPSHCASRLGDTRIVGRAAQQLLVGQLDLQVDVILVSIGDTRSANARFNLSCSASPPLAVVESWKLPNLTSAM